MTSKETKKKQITNKKKVWCNQTSRGSTSAAETQAPREQRRMTSRPAVESTDMSDGATNLTISAMMNHHAPYIRAPPLHQFSDARTHTKLHNITTPPPPSQQLYASRPNPTSPIELPDRPTSLVPVTHVTQKHRLEYCPHYYVFFWTLR